MKPRTKRFLNTAYLSFAVGVMTGCLGGGGGPGDPATPENPTADTRTLTVTNAPSSVGGSFVPTTSGAEIASNSKGFSIGWNELDAANSSHIETIGVTRDLTTGQVLVIFSVLDSGIVVTWACSDLAGGTVACSGIMIDRTAGVVTFANQVLTAGSGSSAPPITLIGTLTFTLLSSPTPTPTPGPTPVPTPWPGTSTPKGNNGALLSGGTVIGKGTVAVGDLRKQIAVTILGTNSSFSVGTAFATRPTNSIDSAFVFLPVTNTGSQTLCYVKLSGITYRDASDAVLHSNGFTYVQGSVVKFSSPVSFTDTCLAPNETGMVANITANIYAAVTKMEFTLSSASYAVSSPIASVIPQSYTFQPATSTTLGALAIKALNVGAGSALVGAQYRYHTWFLLDDAEQPLAYGLTDHTSPSVIAANGIATITGDVWYDGTGGSKLRVFVDFEDTSLPASLRQTFGLALPTYDVCAASLPTDELMLCRNEIRNQRLESLKSTYDTQGSTP